VVLVVVTDVVLVDVVVLVLVVVTAVVLVVVGAPVVVEVVVVELASHTYCAKYANWQPSTFANCLVKFSTATPKAQSFCSTTTEGLHSFVHSPHQAQCWSSDALPQWFKSQ